MDLHIDFTDDQLDALEDYFGVPEFGSSLETLVRNFAADLVETKQEADERVRVANAAVRAREARHAERKVEDKGKGAKPVAVTPAS